MKLTVTLTLAILLSIPTLAARKVNHISPVYSVSMERKTPRTEKSNEAIQQTISTELNQMNITLFKKKPTKWYV
jgi:hypothetical protein